MYVNIQAPYSLQFVTSTMPNFIHYNLSRQLCQIKYKSCNL